MSDANMIEAVGLSKRYGETQALQKVDLEVAPGAILGVLGPNGAGKTTALRVLTTLSTPDGGRAWVAGHDVVAEAAAVRATPLQARLGGLARWMVVLGVVVTVVLGAAMVARGESLRDAFLVGVSVAVAAVPEGLAATVTIALAFGSREMARRGAIVRTLSQSRRSARRPSSAPTRPGR